MCRRASRVIAERVLLMEREQGPNPCARQRSWRVQGRAAPAVRSARRAPAPPPGRGYDGSMPLRVAMIAAECEPWAKTGGLGDVVDALSRALAHVPGAIDGDVEVFLPRYRSVPVPAETAGRRT